MRFVATVIDLPERERLQEEIASNPDLKEQLDQLGQAVEECVGGVLDEVHQIVGTAHATEMLSMWEGLGRFTREALGVEPLTLVLRVRPAAGGPGGGGAGRVPRCQC
jgi:hypothetical protein